MPAHPRNNKTPDGGKRRWSADDRARRDGAPSRGGQRSASSDGGRTAPRRDRFAADSGGDRRPDWQPGPRNGAPKRDRFAPRRDDDRRPQRDDDRQGRRQDDAPRSFRDRDERPARRPFDSDRPARRSFDGDRPARRDFDGERPARRFSDGDRPARRESDGERPAHRFSDGDRPARRSFDGDRAPRRPSGDDRPARRPYSEDRPERRSFREDRPERRSFDRDDRRPARTDDRSRFDREPRRPMRDQPAERYVPTEDVVLERLEAEVVTADEVAGSSFADLGLGQQIVRALAELGATEPFPIQAATIPVALERRNVLGRGRTGSGKTIAFGAALVERLMRNWAESGRSGTGRRMGRAPRALVLAPTRELALQIDRTVQPIARAVGLFTTQIVGGVPQGRQVGALGKGVDIVIGTPGRIEDLHRQGRLDLSEVEITVLDEADHMAELGFLEPMQRILALVPEGGQRMLFSATLDSAVAQLVEEFLPDPAVHEVADAEGSGTADHRVLVIEQSEKLAVLTALIASADRTLVFARTRAFAEQLADDLDDAGIRAESLHGDLNQARRTRNLQKFSEGRAQALVATDVAARGIHVDGIDLVIHADAADEYKTYLHRSGRTGRAGASGTVVTLINARRRRRTTELLERAGVEAAFVTVKPGQDPVAALQA